MARGSWMWVLVSGALCLSLVTPSEILPWEEAALDPSVLQALASLGDALEGQPPCNDRLVEIWRNFGKRNGSLESNMEELFEALDLLTPVLYGRKVTACGSNFTIAGESCLHTYNDNKWPWWRNRAYCWLKGGELIDLADVKDLKGFVKEDENQLYWIGARTSPELEFPKWVSVYGERVWSDQESYTSIPRERPGDNCLAVDAKTLQIKSLHCEQKISVVCQERGPGCTSPFEKVSDECFYFEKESEKWADARRACSKKGKLAKIKNFVAVQQLIHSKFESTSWNVWIGGKMRGSRNRKLKWLDESQVNLTTHRHDEELSRGDCLALTSGSFHSRRMPCDVSLPYLCVL